MQKAIVLALFALFLGFVPLRFAHAAPSEPLLLAAATKKPAVKKAVPKKAVTKKQVVKKPVKKPVTAKKKVVKKPAPKKVTKKTNLTTCVRCKSLAEGADTSAAAKATQWKGTIIGINDGDRSLIMTDALKLDHIKAHHQRYVLIEDGTAISSQHGDVSFSDVSIGSVIQVRGVYDAKKRTIRATSVQIVKPS